MSWRFKKITKEKGFVEQVVNSEIDDVENIKTEEEARQIIIDDPEIREEIVGYIDHLF